MLWQHRQLVYSGQHVARNKCGCVQQIFPMTCYVICCLQLCCTVVATKLPSVSPPLSGYFENRNSKSAKFSCTICSLWCVNSHLATCTIIVSFFRALPLNVVGAGDCGDDQNSLEISLWSEYNIFDMNTLEWYANSWCYVWTNMCCCFSASPEKHWTNIDNKHTCWRWRQFWCWLDIKPGSQYDTAATSITEKVFFHLSNSIYVINF